MFELLLTASVILAFGLAFGVSLIFRGMTQNVLSRYLAENATHATAKYLQITILLVGVSSGARIQLLKDYLHSPAYNEKALHAQMTTALWSLALFNTAADTLSGILWLMILFAFLAAVAVAFIRKSTIPCSCRRGKKFALPGPSKPANMRISLEYQSVCA